MIFKNAKIENELLDFEVSDGVFKRVEKIDADGIDLGGLEVYPGLFDIHIHGCVNHDTMDGDGLLEMSEFLLQNGTTSYLPTTMTVDMADIKRVTDIDIKDYPGVSGFHMEGPYICEKYKGAQNKKYIKNPDIDEFNTLKNIKMVTIAPELSGSMEFIKACSAVVSLGHTDTDYETASEAIKNGAMCITHTFNAMSPLHHRNPGAIGAAIEDEIYVQAICDGLHLHKSIIKMLYKTFGTERMVLISDSMRAAGMPDGKYDLGGQDITVKDGVAKTQDGAIAGSTSTLFQCVKKAIEFGIPKEDAFKMASLTPAVLMGLKKGKICTGYDAEFIAVDENLDIKFVFANGKLIEK